SSTAVSPRWQYRPRAFGEMRRKRSAAPLFATCCYLWPHVCTTAPPCASAATSTTAFAAFSLDGSRLRHPS
ncbi:unnamed protein product, partial [Ectocarpus sp. 4 AP-2014]